jgi:hypothetical protein
MPRLSYAITRFAALDNSRRRALLSAVHYLTRAWTVYRRESAAVLVQRLEDGSVLSRRYSAPVAIDAAEIHWALDAAARWLPFRADCLVQALAADLWLERQRIARRFHIAVAPKPGEAGDGDPADAITAHAWLEVDGRPVSGGALAPYVVHFAATGGRVPVTDETGS